MVFDPYAERVIHLGWRDTFRGKAALALMDHILWGFNINSHQNSDRYARYCAIVQSSGMGKSRAVDELSKSQFVIPVVLRPGESTGFPPGDGRPYDSLSSGSGVQIAAFLKSCALLHSLFRETTLVVQGFKDLERSAAAQFRSYMIDGMSWSYGHSERRNKFYQAVMDNVQKYIYFYENYFGDRGSPPSDSELRSEGKKDEKEFPLRGVFRELCKALEDWPMDDQKPPEGQKSETHSQIDLSQNPRPAVVLVVDEAHVLTKESNYPTRWSFFGELCRALRGLSNQPLFTLFVSTCFSVAAPPGDSKSSDKTIVPFFQLGFDQLVHRLDFSQKITVSQVSSDQQVASFGRPLWRPYLGLPEEGGAVIYFATHKLLGGVSNSGQFLDEYQKLACLARRIPIEFASSRFMATPTSAAEKEQVRSHMRVILGIKDSLQIILTMSSSEPVLAEAAYSAMNGKPGFNPPFVLKQVLNHFQVYRGEVGELTVALLFIMARDKAVGPPNGYGLPLRGERWCSLTELLTSLFLTPPPDSADHLNVLTSPGWCLEADKAEEYAYPLGDTFQDSKVYFTHFIKAEDHEVAQAKYLLGLMARGAAIICVEHCAGIHGVIPFLLSGDELRLDNIGAIMFRVSMNAFYTDCPEAHVFRDMDPRKYGIIAADIPVIRFFFALASDTPAIKAVHHESSGMAAEKYRTYDFWVTGLSPEVLVPVAEYEGPVWDDILEKAHCWEKTFSSGGKEVASIRRTMDPGVAFDEEFWENWCDSVPRRR